MCPYIFNVIDSYVVMLLLGVIAALLILLFFLKKNKASKVEIIDLSIIAIGAIIVGIIFACLFENLYEYIESPSTYKWTWGMTFYGGLFGGVITFFPLYFFWYKKHHSPILNKVLIIAPASITAAHFLGRIGCFLAGCCYGKETNAWYGIKFVTTTTKVIPTQLIEALGLLLLTIILVLLAFKKSFKYNFVIYMSCYGVMRFLIEFLRGDDRGAFLGVFSPSQIWCFALLIASVVYYFLAKKVIYKNEK